MKSALLVFVLILGTSAYAQSDDGAGFGGGGFGASSSTTSTWTSDPTPTSTPDTSSWKTDDTANTGGGFFGSNESAKPVESGGGFLSGVFSSRDDGDRRSTADSTPLFGSPNVTAPSWSTSVFNDGVNPLLNALAGQNADQVANHPTQSFNSLIVSRSPVALFLDLNGDGTRGGYLDGLLYNLWFGSYMDNSTTYTSSNAGSTVTTVAKAEPHKKEHKQQKIEKAARENIGTTRIVLVDALSDGREAASLEELTKLLKGDNAGDRQIALASIATLAVLNPALTSFDGPIVGRLPFATSGIVNKLNLKFPRESANAAYTDGGNRLAMAAASARLATVAALVEASLEQDPTPREETVDALRAALYFTAFEYKRLKISNADRDKRMKSLLSAMVDHAPKALRLAAESATDKRELARLEDSLVATAPILDVGNRSQRRLPRVLAGSIAAATTVGLWLAGGDWALEHISSIATQLSVDGVMTYPAPALAAIATYWGLRPRGVRADVTAARPAFTKMCAEALTRMP